MVVIKIGSRYSGGTRYQDVGIHDMAAKSGLSWV